MAHFGISAALLTPFGADGSINLSLFCTHARDLLKRGIEGVTAFGTTGEGASIGLKERAAAISALLASGISASKITLGVSSSALDDALAQIQQGIDAGITDFLLLPPFYFKCVEEDGLFDWHARLFNAADHRARFILYHIPQVSHAPLPVDLVMRLSAGFPERIMAIKDSSGSWDNTRALIESGQIPVLVGDERLLHKAAALGAVGSICGMANLYPERMARLFETQNEDQALSAEVAHIVSVPVIPALKLISSQRSDNADWARLRPPLKPLRGEARAAILSAFAGKVLA
ncbi:4-hydroxy-tetrahydrodipicolinate synthase [Roseobacter fucihabitans]|uniref:4-hydroxy-tetrahydrodipicolinate synthase n=1 Tax=Roseobacter fucihabitans TaxID=1537242 RepID=A0ABZ2BR81_9RHOB|nr:dihydrodipicolinate synthase family protein [Roseobacter litoralis]MBC6965424.1 4-hydroxy-tetrahydrodipicolinate synthase [Roseobacter litoralis]